uniref:Uncharacterized protein n=1 Tax=Tanacetum cinerariifolium TaxID=118510 RepID=A0A699GIL0_TANCI|nr:hypothetical protein [Tanacetum cinerariifolium]
MEHVANKAVYKELDDKLVRATTTASRLEAEKDSGGGPRCQEAIRDTIAQTRSERVSKLSNDSLLARGLDLEQIKTTQENKIDSLKRRVKKLMKKQRSRTHKLKRLYKVSLTARVKSSNDEQSLGEDASKHGMISDIDTDEGITLVSIHDDAEMFDDDEDLHGKGVFVAKQDENVVEKEVDVAQVQVSTAATTATISIDEVTLAQALTELKHKKPRLRIKGLSFMSQKKLVEGSSTRVGTELEQKSSKKKKIDDDKEMAELKQLVKIIPDREGVAINAIPLPVKPPSIIDWKIHKEGKKRCYKIIRADGSSKIYLVFCYMLKIFDREDVETLLEISKS